jgi:RimJ/RimL family protein N-acetyltransferase
MLNKSVALLGTSVVMRGVDRTDFASIIEWRNDPENSRYLNQPYKLTMDLQTQWYTERYLPSDDLLFVFVERCGGNRIGTLGLNDFDPAQRSGIAGRLLIGDKRFRGSFELLEGNILFYDFLFEVLHLERVFCHIVQGNRKAVALDSRLGFHPTEGPPVFPHYCHVHGMELVEMVNTRESYRQSREAMMPMVEHFLQQYGAPTADPSKGL